MVEFTLNWNHVLGVTGSIGLSTPGQLLPALIGAFSFLRTLWLLYGERKGRKAHEPVNTADYETPVDDAASPYGTDKFHGTPVSGAGPTFSPPHTKHNLPQRALYAWLPWLTELETWRHSRSTTDTGYDSAPLGTAHTAYKPVDEAEIRIHSA